MLVTQALATAKSTPITSLVNAEYNEPDDSSNTPPLSPNKITQTLMDCGSESKMTIEKLSMLSTDSKSKSKNIKRYQEKKIPIVESTQFGDEEFVLIESSPDENKHQMFEYDDESDKNFVGAEVSLCAAATDSDQGDLSVLETFPPVGISEIAPSPLVSHDYLLFSSDVDYTVDSDDSLKQLSFIPKDDSLVISYSRHTSESNGEGNNSPLEISEDEMLLFR